MPTRPDTRRSRADDGAETRPGGVFGREWWGFDRDGLEDELARQEADHAAGKAPARAGERKPH